MELTDSKILDALFAQKPKRRVRLRRAGQAEPTSPSRPIISRTPCKCGTCARCLDNAKWDRIFNEKFADPDYYSPQPLQQGSSLGWLNGKGRSRGATERLTRPEARMRSPGDSLWDD
jgi:hypothetical protein